MRQRSRKPRREPGRFTSHHSSRRLRHRRPRRKRTRMPPHPIDETRALVPLRLAGVEHPFPRPGAPGEVKDGWVGILKWQLEIRHRPCNFVEIMPKLEEHQK